VLLWDTSRKAVLHAFAGITGGVVRVQFSPDERLLAAVGADASLFVWEVASREVILAGSVGALKTGVAGPPTAFLCWHAPAELAGGESGRPLAPARSGRPPYQLLYNHYDTVAALDVTWDARIFKYAPGTPRRALLPSPGFVRCYTCASVDAAGRALLCGTSAGEIVTFALAPHLMFKEAAAATQRGMHSMLCLGRDTAAAPAGAPLSARVTAASV